MQQGSLPKICLAFEMRSDQKDPDLSNFKVIPDQDFAHFNFYITHIFGEELVRTWLPLWGATVKTDADVLTDKIYDSLYGASESVTNPSTSHTALVTALDGELPDEAPKGRKRRLLGRVKKQLGDLCLFAGSPVDAMAQYRAAVEISRSCSDWEWVGSTLEAMASAILSVRDASGLKSLSALEVMEVSSRLAEARTFYNRKMAKAPALEADNLIRTANFLLQQDKKIEMADTLSKCQDLIDSMDVTFTSLKIRLMSSIALIYRNADYSRKYAFYIQLIARLCPSAGVPAARSHQLLEQIAPEYDITVNSLLDTSEAKAERAMEKLSALPSAALKTRREKMISAGPTWTKLQASILTLLSDLSFESGDTLQSMKYLTYLMREVSPKFVASSYAAEPSILSPLNTNWGYRLHQLSATLPPPLDTLQGDPLRFGLGLVKNWRPLKDPSVYMHISRSVIDPLFLYRPNRKAKEAIAASAHHSFAWPGASLSFELGLATTNMQRTVLEDVKILYSPIVLSTTEPRPGDIRMEVDWNPPLELDSCVQPTAQVVIEANELATVKISTIIPSIKARKIDRSKISVSSPASMHSMSATPTSTNESAALDADEEAEAYLNRVLTNPGSKILLAPKCLIYTLYNFPFSEPLLAIGESLPKQLLLNCLHYIHAVPTVSVEDFSHPWVSYTATSRDPETILAIGHTAAPNPRAVQGNIRKSASAASTVVAESASTLTLGSQMQPSKAPEPHKSIQNLTVATSQLRGESFSTTLILTNESKFPVDDFGLTIQENGETVGPQLAPQIVMGNLSRIYDIIAGALPLRAGEAIKIPIEFCAPSLGLVQVSFLMEYRNSHSAENMWRKVRMDYSFKVVESLTPISLGVLRGLESSMDMLDRAMPHNVILVQDDNLANPNAASLENENYFLLQLGLQNKTMLSFHVVSEDQLLHSSDAALRTHSAFVVDPWATKLFCIALHRKSFVQRMIAAANELKLKDAKLTHHSLPARYREATKEWLKTALTQFSWKSYGNRSGSIQFDPSLITNAILDALVPQQYSSSVHLETSSGEVIKIQAPPETPGTESYVLQANQIYKICGKVVFLGPSLDAEEHNADISTSAKSSKSGSSAHEISTQSGKSQSEPSTGVGAGSATPNDKQGQAFFSTVVRSRHLNNQARNVTLIGKSQNLDLPPLEPGAAPHLVRIPVLFHSSGIYSITTRVHEAEGEAKGSEEFWTRDLSVVVTR